MKRPLFLLLAALLMSSVAFAQTLLVDGVVYNIDTIQNHKVGPGTDYIRLRLTGDVAKRIDVYFLKADLKNENIEVHTALGCDSIYSGERPSAVAKRKSKEGAFYFAGTNGDFYATTGYVGYPSGVSVVGGEVAKIPTTSWNSFVIDENNRPAIGRFSYSGTVKHNGTNIKIHSTNHERKDNQLKLFNQYNGQTTRTNEYGTEVLVELLPGEAWGVNKDVKVKVLKIEKEKGNMAIPDGKAVLSGHGTSATAIDGMAEGDELTINLKMTLAGETPANYLSATGGDNRDVFLKDGVLEAVPGWDEYHPRTALGYTQNRDTLIFIVIDGRGVSVGATSRGIGQLMLSAGAYNAFNMDGGGSSCMYIAEYGGQVNAPADATGERATSNSIFLVSTAPTDQAVTEIIPYQATVSLPRYGEYTPYFRSYNQYGVLLQSRQEGVVLTCPESVGKIVDGKFLATGSQDGVITATYNGTVTARIHVKFIPTTGVRIRLDSVLIDSRHPYEIKVDAVTASGNLSISPEALAWTVEDESICSVEKGIVSALKNGKTKLTGTLDGATDEISIIVETPELSPVVEDRLVSSEWKMVATSALNAGFNEENRPADWEHGSVVNFVYSETRSPNIKLTKDVRLFGMPDTVKLHLNLGNLKLEKALLYFRAGNSNSNASKEFTVFEQNKDFTLAVPMAELFDLTNRATYPVTFKYGQLYLSGDLTDKTAYSLAIKELDSYYKDIPSLSGIRQTEQNISLHVYPNPLVGDKLYVRLRAESPQQVKASVYTLSGQCVSSGDYQTATGGLLELSMKHLPQGTYLLRLSGEKQVDTVKFVK